MTTLRNGRLTFSALNEGRGPVVLCLHGFPDHAYTFCGQISALSKAGYQAIAPMMRGYDPGSIPQDGDYSIEVIVEDIIGWIDGLGEEKVHLVGHDWGAVAAYAAASRYPDRFYSLTTIAIPQAGDFMKVCLTKTPRQLLNSWYMQFFQMPLIAEYAASRKDWALLKYFWAHWSPSYAVPEKYWERLCQTFAAPGVVKAMLSYYRQNASPAILLGFKSSLVTNKAPILVPALVITGAEDKCMDTRLFDHAMPKERFPNGLKIVRIANAGHFAHREKPEEINKLITQWLGIHTPHS